MAADAWIAIAAASLAVNAAALAALAVLALYARRWRRQARSALGRAALSPLSPRLPPSGAGGASPQRNGTPRVRAPDFEAVVAEEEAAKSASAAAVLAGRASARAHGAPSADAPERAAADGGRPEEGRGASTPRADRAAEAASAGVDDAHVCVDIDTIASGAAAVRVRLSPRRPTRRVREPA